MADPPPLNRRRAFSRNVHVSLTAGMLLALIGSGTTAVAGTIKIWPVDPHTKVFRDAQPGAAGRIALEAARNEYESGQFAFRCDAELKGVHVEVSPLVQDNGAARIEGKNVAWHFVGYVLIDHNTPDSEAVRVRSAPCQVPDPLLEARTLDVPAGQTQPVWITIRVPKDAPPGIYHGTARVSTDANQAELPLELKVDAFTLPDERHLWITNWFTVEGIAKAHQVALWSEPFWTILGRYAEAMAAHRQNVVYTPWSMINVVREADGKLSFDYRRFDRYVKLFEKAGVAGRIEITHVAHAGPGGWEGNQIVLSNVGATDRRSGKQIAIPGKEGIPLLLGDLERHLHERGWLSKAMLHISDEPSIYNVESYRAVSALVHRAAPKLRRIDAIETLDFSGALEVWVPKLSHFDRWREAFEARRDHHEFWYYICCHPYGSNYPNRFLDSPLTQVRVLHWINYGEDLAGYLHWGLNFWDDDPFGPQDKDLPPGDTHVVYPGRDGPLSSIRWEIQRESAEDFEYLHLLATKTAQLKKQLGDKAQWIHEDRRAKELCREVVPAISKPERVVARIMAVRRQIADEIMALDRPPLLLVETEPSAGSTVVNGPIVVEVRGLTAPGAAVKVNGRSIKTVADGRFACVSSPKGREGEIVIEAELNGAKKTTVRRFALLPPPKAESVGRGPWTVGRPLLAAHAPRLTPHESLTSDL